MDRYRNFDPLDIFPSTWLDAIEAALSVAAEQFVLRIKPSDATVLEVPASADEGAAVVWIEGKPRWNEANVEYASPGGGTARNLDVWVVSTADSFGSGGGGETDLTNHAFTLVIRETGVPPVGVAVMRLVGTAHWTGTAFDTVTPSVGRPSPQSIGALPASDVSVTNSRPPNGAAGGDLSGTYPNPQIAAGAILNADVNAAAAIAMSKLALAITNAEVASGAAIAKSKLAALSIVAADIVDATITEAKLAPRVVLTALPGSPTNGQEILYQTAGMAAVGWGPWTLRYDSSLGGVSKWKILTADVRITREEGNGASGGTGGYVDFSDALPAIPLPVAGDYEAEFGASPFHSTSGGQISIVPVATGLPADSANEILFRSPGANSCTASMSRRISASMSGVLKLQFTQTVAGGIVSHRWVAVRPLRVG